MDRRYGIMDNRQGQIEELEEGEFAMTLVAWILTLLIMMLVCVTILMFKNCLFGINHVFYQPRYGYEHYGSQNSLSDTIVGTLESGNPMRYHPHFLSIRHSAVV